MKLDLSFEQNQQNINVPFAESGGKFNADFGEVSVIHDGRNGATFTPNVSEDGILSWTNDRELPNPEPVNIKGKDGKDGKDGVDGYTPIKGKDYFDGKDGADGKDGKDGADGRTPVKGTDYFTEADVQEIAERAAEMVDIPEGGATSWNDLTDKPFGSEFEYTELASATGVVDDYNADTLISSFQATLDFTPINGKTYKLVATDGVQTIEAVQGCTIMNMPAMGLYYENIGMMFNATIPIMMSRGSKEGAWTVNFFATTEVGAEWTITAYRYTEIVTPLDGKYLPDGIPFVASASVGQGIAVKAVDGSNKPTEFEAVNLVKSYNDLTDVPVKEVITTLMGEQTVSTQTTAGGSIGTFYLDGCNLVSFDGEKYKVQEYIESGVKYYGNRYLEGTWNPDNGLPFLLKYNTSGMLYVALYVKTAGTHTISAYKQELTFLSEKYLPDSVVLESELTAKGYQTEEQVTALINNALGVIENGTY